MESVREVHALAHPVQSRCGQGRVLQRNPREPGDGSEGFRNLGWGIALGTAQDPLRFQKHRRADENILAVDECSGLRGLLRMVSGQIPDHASVSIVSMALLGFGDDAGLHLFECLWGALGRQ